MTGARTSRRALMLAAPALSVSTRTPARAKPAVFREACSEFSASSQGFGRWRRKLGSASPRSLASRPQPQNGDQQVCVDKETLGSTGTSPLGLDPFTVGPEGLDITALRTLQALLPRLWTQPFTSGLINTRFSLTLSYGQLRFVAAMPAVVGPRTGFWLLPRDPRSNSYITVASSTGSAPGICHIGVGSADRTAARTSQQAITILGDHEALRGYRIDWGPDRLSWLIDYVEVAAMPTPLDLHGPMIFVIGLPIGDRWTSEPAPGDFAARLRVKEVWAATMPTGPRSSIQPELALRLADQRSPR